MSTQDNICPLCGGMMAGITHTIGASEHTELRTVPSGRLCYGHPEPTKQHDGVLDAQHDMSVRRLGKSQIICIHAGINDVFLKPKHALSLLTWLEENQPMIEQLAKEWE